MRIISPVNLLFAAVGATLLGAPFNNAVTQEASSRAETAALATAQQQGHTQSATDPNRAPVSAAVLRSLLSDPAIRAFVGLAENSWDFTAPDGVPGFGPLQ